MSQPRRIDVVIDLETLGKGPTAPILEIGAVEVADYGLGRRFHRYIDLNDALLYGKPDADTILWWLGEAPDDARKELHAALRDGLVTTLVVALLELDRWLVEDVQSTGVWANGASFDLGILNHAYQSCGIHNRQMDFRAERDLRTAFDLLWRPERDESLGTRHNALADAMMDARRLWEVLYGKSE